MAEGTPPASARDAAKLRTITVDEFVRRLALDDQGDDKRFALFLGAGCSVSSGIPSAADLVRDRWLPRLRNIRAPGEADHEAWAARHIPGYDKNDPGASYGYLIDQLFITPNERQREIESLCDGKWPGFGYAVLAQLVASQAHRFNIVLTTNFDDLVADALYLYTDSRPLVIQHESLATFIRPTRTRPMVVKLHGDHRLAPRNTLLETEIIEADVAHHTAMVLNDRGLVFMGYGGNDKGIQKLLADLPRDALPFGAFWVHPRKPAGPIREWLIERNGVWVNSGWFDEVMLLVHAAFKLPHPDPGRFLKIFSEYEGAFERLSASISAKPESSGEKAELKEAVRSAQRAAPAWLTALSEARRLERADPAAADKTYSDAVQQFPDSIHLFGSYAMFLASTPGREEHAQAMGARASAMYQRALEDDPLDAESWRMYGSLLSRLGKHEEAEQKYRRAIDLNKEHPLAYVLLANLIRSDSARAAEAEDLYRRSLAISDREGARSYAVFLEGQGRRGEAEEFYKKAIEAKPDDVGALAYYADFLRSSGNRDEAEAFYKRALTLDPDFEFAKTGYAAFRVESARLAQRATRPSSAAGDGAQPVNPVSAPMARPATAPKESSVPNPKARSARALPRSGKIGAPPKGRARKKAKYPS